ncbi:tandem-95 repeat protein [Sphingosinicella sp. BN140058]|uniref:tandem-95 repeat protein n=1 Tax=Sphingosinicella sp. BN140058 TaxID=1892855 RepID=UPI0010108A88|nr:tandem-95 repeat protein [Sphingosinicella sp. BN140058]QAY77378.1 tandem-95 repeat protein [Sphingosinicella sp. BN140058]
MVATTLSVGQIAIIGVNSEDTGNPQRDAITFMLLSPIGSGTQIFFTDRSWNGTTFAAAGGNEGTFTYTAGVDLPAGTVITITQAQLTGAGIDLSDAGETVYAYQGAINAPSRFLHAVDIADGTAGFDGNELLNTGLTNGVSAVSIAVDNAEFGTRTHNINYGELFAQINNATDWVQNDNSPQDGTPAGPATTAPDAQIWVAGSGAGEAIVTINLDGTYSSGTVGYQIVHAFQNAAQLFHPSDITLDTVNDKYFFVDADLNGNNRIIQGSISELLANPGAVPNFTVLYSNTGSSATGSMRTLSIDPATQKIYFDVEHSLLRINYDTQAQAGTVLATLDPDAYITQLTINYATGTVYLGSSSVTSVFGSDMIDTNRVFVATGLTGSNAANSLSFSQINWGANGDSSVGGEGNPLPNDSWPVERGTVRGVDVDPVTGKLYIVTGTVILDNDGNGLTTYYGGVWVYDPSNGSVTNLYTQNGSTGPVGLLYYIEVDNATGSYYVIDETGTNGGVGDGGVYRGSLTVAGTPTLLATVGNINGLGPQGLEIQHAPTLVGTAIASLAVTEASSAPASGETSRVALYSGLTASDIDTPNTGDELRGALVRVSGNFQAGATHQDILTINGTQSGTIAGSGISYSYNQANGQMTLSGVATVAEYAAAIALVNFSTSGDNVTAFGTAGTRTISASVFDGLLYSDEINNNVTVTGINDAPVNSVSGAQSFAEDGTRTFNTANGNLISVSDVDADPTSQSLQVTVAVVHGTLTLSGTAGLSFSVGDGTGDATMTFTGTANAINAALNGLVYTPTLDYYGADTLTLTTNDLGLNGNDPGLTGTGTSEQDSDTVAITVTAVADIANDVLNIAEDAAIASVAVQANDTFENSGHAITAFTQGAHGTVVLNDNGTAGNFADDFLQYTANADYNGTDSFTYTVTSGGATETATVNVTLSAVADIANDSVNLTEDAGATTLDVLANDSFEDPTRAITAVGSAAHGIVTINNNGTPGVGSDDYIVYTPTADYNGTDSFTYTVTSGGVTETATVTVNLSAVTDIANDTVSVLEDSGGNTLDLLGNDNFENPARAITAVGSALHGSVSINNNGTVGNTADDYVVYTPTANYNGADSFTYTVTSGGVTETATANVTVTSVNDAPTIGNVQGDSAAFVEGGTAVKLDPTGNAAVADVDSTDFNGGSLTVSITSGKVVAEDVLGLDTSGSVTVAGGIVSVAGQAIGTLSGGGAGGADLVVTFDTANATAARVQTLITALTYVNANTLDPATAARTVAISLVDGDGRTNGGDDDATVTTTITVTAVNDAPAGTNATVTASEDDPYVFLGSNFGFSDGDGNSFAGIVVSSLPAAGTLKLNGVDVTLNQFITAADIAGGLFTFVPAADTFGAAYASFNFQVRDNGGIANGGVDTDASANTITIDVLADNIAPVANDDGPFTVVEDTPIQLSTELTGNDTDAENDTLTIVGVSNFVGGAATVTAGVVTFTPTSNFVGAASFDYTISDGFGNTATATASLTVTAVNDAPVQTIPVGVQTFGEDTAITFNSANGNLISIADVDAGSGTMDVTLSVQTGALTLSSTSNLTVTGDGTNAVTLSGTLADINAALNGLVYNPGGNYNGDRSIVITTNDRGSSGVDPGLSGDGTSEQDSDTILVHVNAVNDAPTVIDDGSVDASVILEDTPGAGQSVSALFAGQYSDVADAQFSAGNPGGSSPGAFSGVAVVTNGSSGSTGQWQYFNSTTTTWVDVGSVSSGAALLIGSGTSIRFNPAANFNGPAPTLVVHLIDNSLGFGISHGQTVDISALGATGGATAYSAGTVVLSQTVTAVNDAPTISALGGDSVAYTENDAPVQLDAGNNALVVDVDSANFAGGTLTITMDAIGDDAIVLDPAIVVDPSTFDVTVSGVSIGTYAPVATPPQLGFAITLSANATPALIQQLIRGLSYTNTGDMPTAGTRTVHYTLVDGDGGTDTASHTSAIVVTAVNDVPVLDLNGASAGIDGTGSYTENGASAFLHASLLLSDADHSVLQSATVTISGGLLSGQDYLTVNGGTAGTINGVTIAYNAATGILTLTGAASVAVYQNLLRQIGFESVSDTPGASRTLTWTVNDGTASSVVASTTIAVTAVNDAPINSLLATQGGTEDSNVVFSAANANAITVSDAEASTLRVTLSVGQGLLTLSGTAGLSFTVGDGTGDATMTFSGTASAINAALDGLIYRGALNYHGVDILNVATSDLGAAGTGGTKTDQDGITINLVTDGYIDGDSGDNNMSGTGGPEQFLFQHGGNDHGDGGGGNDRFYFGDQWNSGDSVDGGTGEDSLQLAGDYTYTFGETQMVSIERLRLNSGGGADFDYYLTMANGNVAAGQQLLVDAQGLVAGETLTFVGIAETNGFYKILSGAGDDILAGGTQNDIISGGAGDDTIYGLTGNDTITGGLGHDILNGGSGSDVFVYGSAAESTGTGFDTIEKFSTYVDRIDLPFAVTGWSGTVTSGGLSTASFDSDLAAAVNAALNAHSAVLFTASSGSFAGRSFAVIDGNGDGSYQAGQDYVIEFAQPVAPLDAHAAYFI